MVDGERAGRPELLGPTALLVVAVTIAGAGTLEFTGSFIASTEFPVSWRERIGDFASVLSSGLAFSYLLAAVAMLGAIRVAETSPARNIARALAVGAGIAGVLGAIGIWHFLSFRIHGGNINEGVSGGIGSGYPWRERLRGTLLGGVGFLTAAASLWLLWPVLRAPAQNDVSDGDSSEPIELTPPV